MKALTINEINKKVIENRKEYILLCENEFKKQIEKTVNYIKENGIKYIFISGPTSSGKTTFSRMFSNFLDSSHHVDISLDDYYKKLYNMPKRKDGEYNFESVYSLRTDEIKKDFNNLINGKKTSVPLVDFETGKHVENGKKVQLTEKDYVIIEGIHALNPKIYSFFDEKKSIKIFIHPEPNIERNSKPISNYDFRFIRRLVRDNNYRKAGVHCSLRMWESVRLGEKEYMNRYKNNAQVIINTFLNYEPCVLKEEALLLLNQVNKDDLHYLKARRLINILNEFVTIERKNVPCDSLLNEFIKKD